MLKVKTTENDSLLLDGDIMLCPDDTVELGIYDHMGIKGIKYREVYDPDDDNELLGFEVL